MCNSVTGLHSNKPKAVLFGIGAASIDMRPAISASRTAVQEVNIANALLINEL
jgi:hypothetical protein